MSRSRQGFLEDLIDLTSKFPWWVGIALAIVSYLVLHPIASSEVPQVSGVQDMGAAVGGQLGRMFATLGQFLLPFAFVLGSVGSLISSARRRRIYDRAATSTTKSAVAGLDWREFEELVGEHFRRQGYGVSHTQDGADGGVDLVLSRDGEKYFVQCKHWKALKVRVNVVRELFGVMAAEGAVGGFVVTSGQFTSEARSFASGKNIELFDGPCLAAMIRKAKAKEGETVVARAVSVQQAVPACPRCGRDMIRRKARKGQNAGSTFWGCSAYPACRGTRE